MQVLQKINYNKIKSSVKSVINNTAKTVKKNVPVKVDEVLKTVPQDVKTGAIVALFLLPTLGVVNKCTSDKDETNIINIYENNKFVEKKDATLHVVKDGDNLSKIARKHNVSVIRLCKTNGILSRDLIHPDDTIIIPPSYTVKNVSNLNEVAEATGFSKNFLVGLVNFEKVCYKPYKDAYGHFTIGIGHLVKPWEKDKYTDKGISKEEIYTLFAQDLVDRELNLRALLDKGAYENLPPPIIEAVIDFIFNKGEGAVSTNPSMLSALQTQDYETVIEHLGKDYSMEKGADGKFKKKYLSGLNKRRLFDLYTASKIYEDRVLPDRVVNTVNKVYKNGLLYLQEEYEKGFYTKRQYHNIQHEYKSLAHKWFGKYIAD